MSADTPLTARSRSIFSLFRGKSRSRRAPAAPCAQPSNEPVVAPDAPRILIVDDDPVVRMATERKLKANGYAVFTAADGPTAIQTARKERPDLILLDLCFPADLPITWDGFRIMGWMHQLEATKKTPVVIFTDSREKNLTQRARAAGAAGFFQKPVNYDTLLSLIELRLKSSPPPTPAPDSLSFEI